LTVKGKISLEISLLLLIFGRNVGWKSRNGKTRLHEEVLGKGDVDNTYKSSLNDDIWAVDYGLKSRIPGEYMEIKSSLF
jgi:hypothetical protein